MHRELDLAFRRAHYYVLAPGGELLLRVDKAAQALAQLLHDTGAHCAALLTAFNPGGRRQAPLRNRQSQQRLRRELQREGHPLLAGRTEDPRGHWPVEPTLLVLDLQLRRAQQCAARYGQVAFLWCAEDGTPRLVETAVRLRRGN